MKPHIPSPSPPSTRFYKSQLPSPPPPFLSKAHLFSAIANGPDEIVVFDRLLRPKELVVQRIQSFLRDSYRAGGMVNGEIQTPSKLAKAFAQAMTSCQMASCYIDFDMGTILRQVLFGEATGCIANPYVPGTPVGMLTVNADPATKTVAQMYSGFFKKLCEEAVPGGRFHGVVLSPLTRGFVGLGIENFVDVTELRTLYEILGGYGFAVIASDLVRLIFTRVEKIKEFITTNTSALHNFKQKHADPESWEAVVTAVTRDIKGLDEFVVDTVVVGNALGLRRLLAAAVREEQAGKVPFAEASVSMAKIAIKRSAYESQLSLAFLSQESCGLMDDHSGTDVDQSVKAALASLGGELT